MRYSKDFFILIVFLIFSTVLAAQVNTEQYRKYYDENKKFMFNFKSTFEIKSGNTEYSSFKGAGRIDRNGKVLDAFVVGEFEYKRTDEKNLTNEGFLHLRSIWSFRKLANWEFFVQQQYDEFIDLNSRSLAGTAIKLKPIQYRSKRDSTQTIDVGLSFGLMAEREEYNLKPDTRAIDLLRSTNFITFDWLVKDKLNLTGLLYYQPAFEDFSNYRITAEAAFEYALAKQIYFVFSINYRYNNKPVTDVKKYDLTVENGIRVEF
jgi:hypothetical protein